MADLQWNLTWYWKKRILCTTSVRITLCERIHSSESRRRLQGTAFLQLLMSWRADNCVQSEPAKSLHVFRHPLPTEYFSLHVQELSRLNYSAVSSSFFSVEERMQANRDCGETQRYQNVADNMCHPNNEQSGSPDDHTISFR